MEPAKKEMAALLQGDVAPLLMPYIPNVTARPHQEKGLVLNLLTEQITAPVLWQPSVEWLLGAHDTIEFLEIGPGKVLQGLVKKIAGQKNPSIRGVSDTTQLRDLTRKGTI
jgi:[acyl-carrier-protein] S-malonyltransferase